MILQPCLRWLRTEGQMEVVRQITPFPSFQRDLGLNPWTFFELAHLFRVSLTNQSADFCLGLNVTAKGAKFQIVEGIISLEPKTLGDPGVTCCRWTRMFGVSIGRLVQLHLPAEPCLWTGFTSVSSVSHWKFTLSDYSVTLVVILWVNGGFHLQLCWRCE